MISVVSNHKQHALKRGISYVNFFSFFFPKKRLQLPHKKTCMCSLVHIGFSCPSRSHIKEKEKQKDEQQSANMNKPAPLPKKLQ